MPRPIGRPRAGVTLLELMVVVVILGVVAVVGGLAVRSPGVAREPRDAARQVAELRRRAVEGGVAIRAVIVDSAGAHAATGLPDGSVIADAALGIDRATGRRVHAAP